MSESTEYEVRITLCVTAPDKQTALHHALDDLRDSSLFGGWIGQVREYSFPASDRDEWEAMTEGIGRTP